MLYEVITKIEHADFRPQTTAEILEDILRQVQMQRSSVFACKRRFDPCLVGLTVAIPINFQAKNVNHFV